MLLVLADQLMSALPVVLHAQVFVDASGRQLSGGAAYRAYKGGNF
jgi:hypothetical protein